MHGFGFSIFFGLFLKALLFSRSIRALETLLLHLLLLSLATINTVMAKMFTTNILQSFGNHFTCTLHSIRLNSCSLISGAKTNQMVCRNIHALTDFVYPFILNDCSNTKMLCEYTQKRLSQRKCRYPKSFVLIKLETSLVDCVAVVVDVVVVVFVIFQLASQRLLKPNLPDQIRKQ